MEAVVQDSSNGSIYSFDEASDSDWSAQSDGSDSEEELTSAL